MRNRETGCARRPRRDSLTGVKLMLLCLVLALAACAGRRAPPVARQCLAELDRRHIDYALPSLQVASSDCAEEGLVRVSGIGIAWNQPALLACPLALALDDFTRDTLDPLALRYLGKRVVLVRHFGAYSCRATRSGHESRHAQGEAIDIAGFVLEDGSVVSVEKDWRRGARGRFLAALARAACQEFSVVLTPDWDADHVNHIHLDRGRYRLCGVRSS
jgi:hypothetical protein